jgi:hypothetical protein
MVSDDPWWLSDVGGLPPLGVPISCLLNLGTLKTSNPMVIGMMGWEIRETFVEALVVTNSSSGYEFVSASV